ncbi:MAG TPA: hypothetical protein VMI75_06620 [Polyangiaceae bacterium]|nr:hypothetical protein [Polyangiaceae bacterium]
MAQGRLRFSIALCCGLTAVPVVACSSSSGLPASTTSGGADGGTEGAVRDAAADVDKAATCAKTFGQAIGSVGFARFDGTVVAIVPPNDQACAEPNSTHLVLQMAFAGATYRMVVDVDDTAAPGSIRSRTMSHDLLGGAWSDGWHSVPLDYVADLKLAASDFTTVKTADAVASITAALDLGAKISVFATAQGEADSAHLIHRNLTGQDGAIVVGADGASPTWLLFAFSDQTF